MVCIEYDEYTIRRAGENDISGIVGLHETVFDMWPDEIARNIFNWKFRANPTVDKLPVFVACQGEEVVGANGHFGLEIRTGDDTVKALQSCDLMVHPDHRRKGIISRLIEVVETEYQNDQILLFSFPSRKPARGYLGRGRRKVEFPLYFMKDIEPSPRSVRKCTVDVISKFRGRTIERYSTPPIDELCRSYRSAIPEGLHVVRDEEFYEWRLADPFTDDYTYLATKSDVVQGAVVVSERGRVVVVRDILPYGISPAVALDIFERIKEDYSEKRHVISWCPTCLDSGVLTDAGFEKASSMLKRNYAPDMVVKDFDGEWSIFGREFDKPENWSLQLLAFDH